MPTAQYITSLGVIQIVYEDKALLAISFTNEWNSVENTSSSLSDLAFFQIEEYFQGKRKKFDLPFKLQGTEFQIRVWQALLDIPYGETRTYKQIAQVINNEKAVRAVGNANNRNPLLLVIPCHRVIGTDGAIVGYAAGIDIKQKLLTIENSNK